MQQRNSSSWMPVSPVTARMWALESMADMVPTRRRWLVPAVRRLAVALARRVTGRSRIAPRPARVERPPITGTRRRGVVD